MLLPYKLLSISFEEVKALKSHAGFELPHALSCCQGQITGNRKLIERWILSTNGLGKDILHRNISTDVNIRVAMYVS